MKENELRGLNTKMFRFISKLPHGEIKVPHPCGICFEGEVEAIVEVAQTAAKAEAEVEQLEEQVEQLEQKIENNEWWKRITDEQVTSLFNRVQALEDEVAALQTVEEVVEEEPEVEPPTETGTEAGETVIEGNESQTESPAEPPAPVKSTTKWGIGL